jgi:hypothetical protein
VGALLGHAEKLGDLDDANRPYVCSTVHGLDRRHAVRRGLPSGEGHSGSKCVIRFYPLGNDALLSTTL